MIRRSIPPQALSTVLLALFLIAVAIQPVRAQDAATQERLERLERDLSMLQRQVYHETSGEAPAGAPGYGSSTAIDVQVRMDRLEQQMRDLTGRIEDETNQVQQLRQRLEQVNSDLEVRFSQQDQGQGVGSGAPQPGPRTARREPPPLAEPAALAPYSRPPPPPPPSFGTLTPPGEPAPDPDSRYSRPMQLTPPQIASAGGADTMRPAAPDALPSGSVSAQYNSAFGLLRKADYPAAEGALRSFVQRHPNDPLAANAQYWLAESFYARGKYTEAAVAFADGYKRYPRGPKAADGLLKLGMSLDHANQKHNACIALMQLDHDFPHAGSAVRDRAAQEKKKLGC